MGVLGVFFLSVLISSVLAQEGVECFSAGSLAGTAVGAFLAALLLVAAAYYLRKLYLNKRKGKHLVFSKDPESVKDEFAFDNPGFRQEETQKGWQHDAPTLPMGGKNHTLHTQFIKPDGMHNGVTKDDLYLQRGRTRRVKLWARDFTGLGLRCSGGAREGVRVHSVLKSGPAAAANLRPGDKIKSIKIEFSGTPLEDAVGIISLASPYPVELEIIEGGRASGGDSQRIIHPLLKRAGSTSDVNSLEKEGKLLHPPKSPNSSNTSQYNSSTLETRGKGGIKKIITEKIITTTTLERNKKEKKEAPTTLERENEKNNKLASNPALETHIGSKHERSKSRLSSEDGHSIQSANGTPQIEQMETQKRDYDPKRGMKFGIRVLPPNVPDDGVLKNKNLENGNISAEKKPIMLDEPDRPTQSAHPALITHESETINKAKPVVAKRREKMAPPIPNVRNKQSESVNSSHGTSNNSSVTSFMRNDLNSSGIKRDENGIPQELPQHMLEAANAARSNRKSATDLVHEKDRKREIDTKKDTDFPKSKRAKGKAPSPPENEKNKTDDSILEQLKNVKDFLKNELQYSSLLHDSSLSNDTTVTSYNTSTPKINKMKSISRLDDSINFSQEDIDDIVSKPFKRESDSLNNFYEESKSNLSSNLDVRSMLSLNNSDKSEKGSTTIELNNSDITIHSSPLNDTLRSTSDEASMLDENERKATSLGDLSRFDVRMKACVPSTGTLERAQSLDISADDADINDSSISPKKRKANSVVETTFFDSSEQDILPDMLHTDRNQKHKEPRLSLNIAKASAMEGLNTFQRNRLKKASEFGNLEDAIVKGSSSSIESDKNEELQKNEPLNTSSEDHESSDHLARRIMDENIKVHLKLVSEFAKSTSDNSNLSSLESPHESRATSPPMKKDSNKTEEKPSITYDTNIPDDLKVSRSTYVNSLERPKSEMMKKLLAKNPILNVQVDQNPQTSNNKIETPTPMTDASKSAINQPDIVTFDLKSNDIKKDRDDFISNVRVGSNNNSLKYSKPLYDSFMEWTENAATDNMGGNIVTITTNEKPQIFPPNQHKSTTNTFTKSIEISEPNFRHVPDVIEGIKRRLEDKEEVSHGSKTLYMEAPNMEIIMSQEPVQKTVTVNVAEDEFGNKVITQNIEKYSTKYFTTKSEVPLQVEQLSFGIMKNPDESQLHKLEEGDDNDIDKSVLEEIKRQNPHMHIITDEPAYSKTETIILNTQLDEEQALALMEKIKNDPSFTAEKSTEELSQLGIRIIHDLEDIQNESHDTVEVTKSRYIINPAVIPDSPSCNLPNKNNITEIQVSTPKSEKAIKQKDKIASRQRAPAESEPMLMCEVDTSLLNDFITNEQRHTAKQYIENEKKNRKSEENISEPKKHHSDYDLPRNSRIQFRTATYESPKGTIMTSTDLENRRLSQLDQIRAGVEKNDVSPPPKPAVSAKPSNIPVKQSEKSKPAVNSSKIPVFMSQKSLSQENLTEKGFSLPRSPPPTLSGSSGNISVTSIKSSSKNPSGKL